MKEFRAALIVVALVVLFIVVVFEDGPVQSSRGGEAIIRTLVYEFQTLIAGIFAVLAAYLTVAQMRESDIRSDARHEQLLRLQKRSDGLVLDRAFNAVLPSLRNTKETLENEPSLVIRGVETFFDDLEPFRDVARRIYHEAEASISILEKNAWAEAQLLFDGGFLNSVEDVRKALRRLKETASYAATHYPPDEREEVIPARADRVVEIRRNLSVRIEGIPGEVRNALDVLSGLLFRIDTLATLYELDV